MNYYLFRHAETENSKYNLPYPENGGRKVEILPDNVPAIERLADYLAQQKIEAFFSSPFKRCLQTAEIIQAEAGVKFRVDQRLAEEMLTHGRESFEALEKRIKSFLTEINASRYQAVAICSHGWPIICLVNLIIKGEVTKEGLISNYPPPGVLICIRDKKLTKIDFRKESQEPAGPKR